ncbi:MAG: phytoene desaturase [Chromatiales bacterium]|jgi:phytoene desaturase|nr:phytoene desaturase [Chromatiales bacterium]
MSVPDAAISPRSAVVIGGGFGGIAAALRAKARGYAVTLLERGERLGGRAQVFERDGFRFDAGPTVVTAPFLFEELFTLFGKRLEDYLTFVPLDPWYRFRFPDGDTFDYGATIESTLDEIRRFDPADVDGYMRLLEHSKRLFEAGFTDLADEPFHNPITMVRQGPRLLKLRAYDSVWRMICRYLRNPKLRQAFSIQPLLVGGSPFDTTSIYGLIHHLEREWGVYFAKGGTGAIVTALTKLLEEEGVDIRTQTTATSITMAGRRATGVVLDNGDSLPCDAVISNADPMHLYKNMVPSKSQALTTRLKTRHGRLSMGLYVLYFGTNRQYPDVAHHTIWMGARYRELLDDIFKRNKLTDDFSLYVHRPTATDASFAPAGCDSFYALAPVPNMHADIDWDVEGPALRNRILAALDDSILPGVREHLVTDFHMTPKDFEGRYLSDAGAGFSVAPYFSQSAWFRFHNRSEGIENLYLTGAGTHPGAGMPGVLCSAKVVEKLLP